MSIDYMTNGVEVKNKKRWRSSMEECEKQKYECTECGEDISCIPFACIKFRDTDTGKVERYELCPYCGKETYSTETTLDETIRIALEAK